uniref:Myopalladin n=1 Tax=Lepisosteus oculatus TaxID=7918 RepID=W5MZV6_LEPOC|nr:PREDICTED: myopalladin isoform X1 [Lepisosteus oculatus]
MQENNLEASTSISQLLRESYLAESRIHQKHSEVSRSEATSHLPFYGNITGKSDELIAQDEFLDLSAFLNQEELDKSVNLARQAIGQGAQEEKSQPNVGNYAAHEQNSPVTPNPNKQFSASTALSQVKPAFQSFHQENVIKSNRGPRETPQDLKKTVRNSPYGVETPTKKEFLNKAADFIEELSSLFKANSSKRIRPRSCKAHRSRYQAKTQLDESVFPYNAEERERPIAPLASQLDTKANLYHEETDVYGQETNAEEESSDTGVSESCELESSSRSYEMEEPIGEPPRFIQKLKSREVPEGSKVQLDCIVQGFPLPEVRWFCEGKELENSPDIQILNDGELHSLIITEAFEEDTGRYSCFASNFYGTDSTSAEIYIEGASSSESEGEQNFDSKAQAQKKTSLSFSVSSPPQKTEPICEEETQPVQNPVVQPSAQLPIQESQSSNIYLQGLDGRPIMAAPVFTKTLQDLTAYEGQLVVLECRIKGAPSPKVEWYREGTLIDDSPDFRILQKKPRSMAEPEEICTLVIAEVFPEDSGTFTCTAKNKYGTVSSIAYLKVKGNENSNNYTAVSRITSQHRAPEVISADPPGCLKPKLEGVLVNHNEPRSSSKAGLRVHFKLPEDEKDSEASFEQGDFLTKPPKAGSPLEMLNGQPAATVPTSPIKEPPPVFAKPKLDPVQLQLLHNQVLLEQQQESVTPRHLESASHPAPAFPEPPANMNVINSTHLPLQQSAPSANTNLPQTFNYARPKQFIAAQTLPPGRGFSPTESPVPMLNAMAQATQAAPKPPAEDVFAPAPATPPHFQPSPWLFQTRVLQSPTSPTGPMASPPPLYSAFAIRAQSPPHAPSPTPSSSTPSPIQNPVAFLSSVLPSLPTSPPTNAMGLPRSAPAASPQGILKKNPKSPRSVSDDEIRDTKDAVLHDLEKKLRFKDDAAQNGQQKLTYEAKMARRLLGPNNAATVFNFDEVQECSPSQDLKYMIESTRNTLGKQQEYKVSSFEQRLMSEIEFRLERTPVDESDDEIQHDEIPTGKCIAPIFDKKLKHFRVMEGASLSFTCKVVGIPVPKVYWFKDGKQISKKNEHYKMKREGDGTCVLHIATTTNDDDGNYTIMAANPQGRISCSGHLIVQTGPVRSRLVPAIHSQRVRSRPQEGERGEPVEERFFRPHFLQAPGDMVAHEGRLCRLDCKVSGLPNPDLMWLLNGKPILPDLNHKMLVRENGVHSLLIDPLMQSDAGTYTCIATNKAGQNSFSLELSVVAKEVKKAPVFLEKLQNTGIPEGSPVRLECRVVGMPPPAIYWKKDNDTIPASKERMSMHQDATGYVCLQIQPTRKEDAGWYTVSAKNEAGIVSCTARLDIYAQWHQQIPQPMRKVRPSGSRYAALTGQGLDIMSAFPTVDNSPILFTSTPAEAALESEEL